MERSLIFKKFVEKWTHPEYSPHPVERNLIDECASTLKIKFPKSYIEYITNYGVGGTTGELLDSIDEGELDINDLSEFYTPEEILSSAGSLQTNKKTRDLIPIASDSMGNMFCFKRKDMLSEKDDAAIWFFDHDFNTVEKTHKSFTSWIKELVSIDKLDG